MLIELLAILGVVLFIAGFVIIFNRRHSVGKAAFDEDESTAEEPETPESQETPTDKVFAAVDTSNTQDATGYGYDAIAASKNVSFEDKLGKDTVIVELPAKKAIRKTPKAKTAKAAPKVALGATPEELAKILEKKIARRVDVLKVAKLSEDGDATLKRLRNNLAKVKAAIDESKKAAASTKKAPSKKESNAAKDDVIRVSVPGVRVSGVTKKAAKKSTKKAGKKAPAKKRATKKK